MNPGAPHGKGDPYRAASRVLRVPPKSGPRRPGSTCHGKETRHSRGPARCPAMRPERNNWHTRASEIPKRSAASFTVTEPMFCSRICEYATKEFIGRVSGLQALWLMGLMGMLFMPPMALSPGVTRTPGRENQPGESRPPHPRPSASAKALDCAAGDRPQNPVASAARECPVLRPPLRSGLGLRLCPDGQTFGHARLPRKNKTVGHSPKNGAHGAQGRKGAMPTRRPKPRRGPGRGYHAPFPHGKGRYALRPCRVAPGGHGSTPRPPP